MAKQVPDKGDPTYDKSQVGKKSQQGNPTVTDVPLDELKRDAKRTGPVAKRDTVEGKAKKPATSSGSDDVAPIIKQNQDTDSPAISMVPPVYGHPGIKDITKAKTDWEVAEAKLEARYGLALLDTKTKEQRKELLNAEYMRDHNQTLDPEQLQTRHYDNEPQEYRGNVQAKA
jgi:hypothetical protein